MGKIDIKEVKYDAYSIFNTKKEMLNYLSKTSFNYKLNNYRAIVQYCRKKWVVRWEVCR